MRKNIFYLFLPLSLTKKKKFYNFVPSMKPRGGFTKKYDEKKQVGHSLFNKVNREKVGHTQ
jgi:hypothetical protein